MNANPSRTLAIGISARVLFELRTEDEVLRAHGRDAYRRYQLEQADHPLPPGPGLPMIAALLRGSRGADRGVEVVVLSENVADASLRVLSSARQHDIEVSRAAFTGGDPLARYLQAFQVDLFLSDNEDEAASAMEAGIAAALVRADADGTASPPDRIRIALDGRAIALAVKNGNAGEDGPQGEGSVTESSPVPVPRWIRALAGLQGIGSAKQGLVCTALISSEEAPARERILCSLRKWEVELDQAFFTGASSKAGVLGTFRPHIVFDVLGRPSSEPRKDSPTETEQSKKSASRSQGRGSSLSRLGLRS